MATFLDRSGNQYQIEHLHQHVYDLENLVKIDLVVFEISLLQSIVKKERKKKKESNNSIYISLPAEAWRANNTTQRHLLLKANRKSGDLSNNIILSDCE